MSPTYYRKAKRCTHVQTDYPSAQGSTAVELSATAPITTTRTPNSTGVGVVATESPGVACSFLPCFIANRYCSPIQAGQSHAVPVAQISQAKQQPSRWVCNSNGVS